MNGKYIGFLPSFHNETLFQQQQSWTNISGSIPTRHGSGHEDPSITRLRNFIEVWLCTPIAILGILGNLVSFIVLCLMRKHKLRSVTTMLQSLSVSDTLVLLAGFLLRSMRYLAGDRYVVALTVMFPVLFATTYALRLINTWLTVLLTFDRYVAVCYPLHAHRICTTKKTYVQIACVILFSFAFCVPRYFESETVYKPGNPYPQYRTTELMDDRIYAIVYRILLFLLIQYVLPMIVFIVLNGRVVCALRAPAATAPYAQFSRRFTGVQTPSTCGRRAPGGGEGHGGTPPPPGEVGPSSRPFVRAAPNTATKAVTRVVVAVVLLCAVCHVIAMTSQVVWSVQTAFVTNARLDFARRLLSNFTNLVLTFNSAVNFLIYCALSRNFRAVLDRCLAGGSSPCRRQRRGRGRSRRSSWFFGGCGGGRSDSRRSEGEGGGGGDGGGSSSGNGRKGCDSCKSRTLSTGYSAMLIPIRATTNGEKSVRVRTEFA